MTCRGQAGSRCNDFVKFFLWHYYLKKKREVRNVANMFVCVFILPWCLMIINNRQYVMKQRAIGGEEEVEKRQGLLMILMLNERCLLILEMVSQLLSSSHILMLSARLLLPLPLCQKKTIQRALPRADLVRRQAMPSETEEVRKIVFWTDFDGSMFHISMIGRCIATAAAIYCTPVRFQSM